MDDLRVQNLDDRVVFSNLVAAGDMVGMTKVIEATKSIPSTANSNAPGDLKSYSSLQDVCDSGFEAGKVFSARFSR